MQIGHTQLVTSMASLSQDSLIIQEDKVSPEWRRLHDNLMKCFTRKEQAQIRENGVSSIDTLRTALRNQFNIKTEPEVLDKTIDRLGRASEHILSLAAAVDTVVQADPTRTAVIWGSIKLILMILARHKQLLESIAAMVEEMDRVFPLIDDYTKLFESEERVQKAAAFLVYEYLSFYTRSVVLVRKRRSRVFFCILWKSEQRIFDDCIKNIAKLKDNLEKEAGVASMKKDASYQATSEAFMEKSEKHQDKIEKYILTTNAKIVAKLPFHLIQYGRNPLFFGRQDLMKTVESHLKFGIRSNRSSHGTAKSILSCALYGLGGIGKTQTALELTYRMQSDCDIILWIPGSDNPHTLSQAFSRICKRLELDPHKTADPGIERQCVIDWLEETDMKWLIVFDNSHDYATLRQYWPSVTRGEGRIVITSRNSEWRLHMTNLTINVSPMSAHEGVDFLNYWLQRNNKHLASSLEEDERQTMEALIRELDGLPLYITHVAGYILQAGCSVSTFSQMYKAQFGDVTSGSVPMSVDFQYNLTWGNVWDLSFRSLEKDSLVLINMFAFLAPDGIPQSLFFEFQPVTGGTELTFNGKDQARFYKAIQDLSRHSLVTQGIMPDALAISKTKSTNIYAIHREVKRKLLFEMGKDTRWRAECFQNILLLLAEAFPKQSDQGETMTDLWPECDKYAASLLALSTAYHEAKPPFSSSKNDESFARLLYHGSWYLWEKRFIQQALSIAEIAEKVILKVDKGSLLYSDILTVIAVAKLESSRCKESLVCFRRVYAIVEAHLVGNKNPGKAEMIHLANAANNVAAALIAVGTDLVAASEMLKRAGELKRKWTTEETEPSLFSEHYCNEGRLKVLQGEIDEGVTLSWRAVKVNRKVYGNTNMSRTTLFMDNLVFTLKAAGRHEEASQIVQEIFELRVKYLGEQVPDTALSYHSLAAEYLERGNLPQARSYLKTAIAILEKSYMTEDRLARSTYLLSDVLMKLSLESENEVERREAAQEAEEYKRRAIAYYKMVDPDSGYEEDQLEYKHFEELIYCWYM